MLCAINQLIFTVLNISIKHKQLIENIHLNAAPQKNDGQERHANSCKEKKKICSVGIQTEHWSSITILFIIPRSNLIYRRLIGVRWNASGTRCSYFSLFPILEACISTLCKRDKHHRLKSKKKWHSSSEQYANFRHHPSCCHAFLLHFGINQTRYY